MLLAGPALAAPTCQDRNGDTIRCGVPGAMPVGWKPSPEFLCDRQLSRAPDQNITAVLETVGGIALFLVLIALLPDFDGAEGWDRQEGDRDEKG